MVYAQAQEVGGSSVDLLLKFLGKALLWLEAVIFAFFLFAIGAYLAFGIR